MIATNSFTGMLRDGGQDNRNNQAIPFDCLNPNRVGPGEMDQANEMSLSQLLEPTPVDPKRMIQVDKLPLFNARAVDRNLDAIVPLLSSTRVRRAAFPSDGGAAKKIEAITCDSRLVQKVQSTTRSVHSTSQHTISHHVAQELLNAPIKPLETPSRDQVATSIHSGGKSTQFEQWNTRYEQLVAFQKEFHHCCVPLNYPRNPSLAHWVKRQRYQYRMKSDGKHSTLTEERQKSLEKLGFVWDSHAASWEERWNQLNEFRQQFGHSRVPKNYPANPPLVSYPIVLECNSVPLLPL